MIRFLTAGESHGPAEVAILEGIPAGLPLQREDIQIELDKRRSGAGRGGRGMIEKDQVKILSGIRFGKTLGSPIALMVENEDSVNWGSKMSQGDIPDGEKEKIRVTTPRPGHTDLAGATKYGFDDIRSVLERASARETIMRVAVGAVCKKLLREFEIEIASHTVQIGQIRLISQIRNFEEIRNSYKTDPDIRCIDKTTSQNMRDAILTATKEKNTLGGVIEIIAHGVPIGLGSHVHFDRKLDGKLAGALMSIPSVKAVEIGEGIENAGRPGSEVHDEIYPKNKKPVRTTNRAGGLEGGITNGEDIIARIYHKPISTLAIPLNTMDLKTGETAKALVERSDICVVPRAGVIAESMVAYVLVQTLLEKFGGDSLEETKRNFEGYNKNV